MNKPMICIVNAATGTEVVREMNDAEYQDFLNRTTNQLTVEPTTNL